MKHEPRSFDHTLDIAAPVEAVWKALADGSETARWFAPFVSVEPAVGGTVVWEWRNHFRWPQTIEVFESERHLRTRYDSAVPTDDGSDAKKPLFIDFFLEGDAGSTTLRLVHSGFDTDARFDDEFDAISGGWTSELRSLQLYLERHRGRERHLSWAQAKVGDGAASVWSALMAADALGCGAACDGLAPGDRFEFTTGDGDAFACTAINAKGRDVSAIATSHGDGLLRVWVGDMAGGGSHVWVWLATYGDAPPAGIQERWDAMLQRVFAGRLVTEAPSS